MSILPKLIPVSFLILASNLFVGYSVYNSHQKLRESEQWVQHTEEIIFQLKNMHLLNKDVINASQGFILSNDSSFLRPLYAAKKNALQIASQLRILTQDNHIQRQRIDSINFYIDKCLSSALQTIDIKNKHGLASIIVYASVKQGKFYADRVNETANTIQLEENILLKQRMQINERSVTVFNRLSVVLFLLGIILTFFLLIATGKYLIQNREKEKRAAELVIANEELRFQNQEKVKRAAELIIANEELLFQNTEKEKRAAELFIANVELIKEEAKKEFERNNLDALINNTNDLMWSVDRYFKLISFNKPFDETIKLSSNKILEKGDDILASGFSPEKLVAFKTFYERAFAGETFTEIERSSTPENTWSEISFHPIREGNKVIGTACHSRDITQRKNVELKVEEQNIELTKTNSELDNFVYSVSHDLRSPLASVMGLVSLIDEESEEVDTLEYARMIRISVKRLDRFIRNVLSYSKNNRIEIEAERIPLEKKINEIVDTMRNMKEAEGIHFEVNIQQKCYFYTDKQRFNTVMENIIANAIKYQKESTLGRNITITGKSDKASLHIHITDNGIGILPQYHEKIFEMFFRIAGKIAGSGIGLYIVKEIITKLQGSIEVHSEEGIGSSFTVTLKNLRP